MKNVENIRSVLTCHTFNSHGEEICDQPARWIVWGHLYEKRDKGPKCDQHLPEKVREQGMFHFTGIGIFQAAIYEIPQNVRPVVDVDTVARARSAADYFERRTLTNPGSHGGSERRWALAAIRDLADQAESLLE